MSYEAEMEERVYALEEELEASEAVNLQLRTLLDTVHDIAFSGRDDKYKISDIRVALKRDYD